MRHGISYIPLRELNTLLNTDQSIYITGILYLELQPDARILHLPDGQDILLIMRDNVPHIATPLLYIVFPQLKRNQIDYTKNRQDLNLHPQPSTQPEVKVLRDHGMVGRKTFRCLLFSLSDVAKMVQRVDVPIPECVLKVLEGQVSCDTCFQPIGLS